MIQLDSISKDFRSGDETIHALRDISLSIESAQLAAVVGPSGGGKTTLLNVIGHLTIPTAGVVTIDGEKVGRLSDSAAARYRNANFGYVVQDFALVEQDSVYQNVRIPLIYARRRTTRTRQRVAEALTHFGIESLIDHRVDRLSGGQRQRVALARAIINKPRIILADEPTGSLDAENGRKVLALLRGLTTRGHTVILATHDEHLAEQADTTFTLDNGELQGVRTRSGNVA